MTIADRSRVDLREVLRTTCAASPVEAIDVMADGLATLTGATYVQFLITNITHRAVVRFAGSDANAARVQQENGDIPVVPLRGTVYDQVLRRQKIVRIDDGGGERILVPVTESGDALGVIDLHLPREADALVFADIAAVAEALARIVIASRRHSDLMDWAQDTAPFSLAAEIQRRLLPGSYTCETDRFTVAGWLEPANAVGGDTFDYSLNRDTLHLSVTDAVGNDVNAALLASVLLGSLRNSRRRGADLASQARIANDALAAHAHVGQFVTGQLARVDLHTGSMTVVNAGHPLPYRVRDGRVSEIDLSRRHALRPVRGSRPAGAAAAARTRRPDRAGHRRHAGTQRRRPRPARDAQPRGAHAPPRDGLRARGDGAGRHRRRPARRRDGAVPGLAWRPR